MLRRLERLASQPMGIPQLTWKSASGTPVRNAAPRSLSRSSSGRVGLAGGGRPKELTQNLSLC